MKDIELKKKELELKIEKESEKMKQLKNKKKMLMNQEKNLKRKMRTRRLIENGALAEMFFMCEEIDPEDFKTLLAKIVNVEGVVEILRRN